MTKQKIITFLIIIIVVLVAVVFFLIGDKKTVLAPIDEITTLTNDINPTNNIVPEVNNSNTYIYTNHGFSIELPKGYVPYEEQSEGGPSISIMLPNGSMNYITDVSFWKKYNIPEYTYLKDEKMGNYIFKEYAYGEKSFYWFEQGNIGFEFHTDNDTIKTFKFIGWSQN